MGTLLKRIRLGFLVLAAGCVGAAVSVQKGLRGSALEDTFDVLGFAAWAPSYFYALGMASICLSLRIRGAAMNAVYIVIGAMIYEAAQALIPERTVDWRDFAATGAALASALLLHALQRSRQDRAAA